MSCEKEKQIWDLQSLHSSSQPFLREGNDFDIFLNLQDIYFKCIFAELIKICFDSAEKLEFGILILSLCVRKLWRETWHFAFVCMSILLTFSLFFLLRKGQRDRETCDVGLWNESNGGSSVVQRLTQKLVWNSKSFVYLYVCSGCSTASLSVCLAVLSVYSTELCMEGYAVQAFTLLSPSLPSL